MDASELVQEYFRRTTTHRTDLDALAEFMETRASGNGVVELKLAKLFWHTHKPSSIVEVAVIADDSDEEFSNLPQDLENAFLEELAQLEREYRIPYVPDSEDPIDVQAASRYVHVSAASALRHLKRDGFNDYVRQTLEEVRKILHRRGISYDFRPFDYMELESSETKSLYGVRALILCALSHIRYMDTMYEEAFRMAVDAFTTSLKVDDALHHDEEYLKELLMEGWLGEEEELEEEIERDLEVRREILMEESLPIPEPQFIVDAFEGLKRQAKSEDWRVVVRHCDLLAGTTSVEVKGSRVLVAEETDDSWREYHNPGWQEKVRAIFGNDGRNELWDVYWHHAQGWAEAQLGQNELRDFLRQQERDASGKRLIRYFFGETWRTIPEKARERLVNVDQIWFSEARGAAIDAVLNDLQVAAETSCHAFIWEPLRQAKGGMELLDFKKRDTDLNKKGFSPTLSDYSWVCRQPFFKGFVQGHGVSESEQLFLVSDLLPALNKLRRARDSAQHSPEKQMRRDEVEPFVRLFLGIGRPGVLRRLAEVGPKLTK